MSRFVRYTITLTVIYMQLCSSPFPTYNESAANNFENVFGKITYNESAANNFENVQLFITVEHIVAKFVCCRGVRKHLYVGKGL